ncbi:MAG TPA: cob(I)yrinic acid a,c-diamide adenosyltransferase [Deltaproteobacteria bacterium]|nr:cob(I)yrinic acid a,c-diamide adenosyltransferase [Deltaproteobacteria bacterium]
MKIYTKTGDAGQTYLFGGGPFPKDNERIEAYGDVDELNTVVGLALAGLETEDPLRSDLLEVQKQLFLIGAELASVKPDAKMIAGFLQKKQIESLEKQIDAWETELEPLKKFILPGGHSAAAALHQARTVCRRAERSVVALSHDLQLRPELLIYLNRLSDWFFVLARVVNRRAGVEDILWEGILKI